ncbi:MAG: hypothetical protein M3R71_04180 [Actinomycetota bacterium]|nr:hypothetical protein [Actinomycetota bacterium]
MPYFIARVWVPDRPGALGAVASRIGAVRGDLVGIDILERGGGRAIDELVISLPDASLVSLLVSEIGEVDGVDVEDIRPATESLIDPRLDALETAASLVAKQQIPDLLEALARRAAADFQADWAVVLDLESSGPERPSGRRPVGLSSVGPVPPTTWLQAFIAGSRASTGFGTDPTGPDDVAWTDLAAADLVVVLGRRGRPWRARERRQLTALARIVDQRWSDLVAKTTRELHPSRAR